MLERDEIPLSYHMKATIYYETIFVLLLITVVSLLWSLNMRFFIASHYWFSIFDDSIHCLLKFKHFYGVIRSVNITRNKFENHVVDVAWMSPLLVTLIGEMISSTYNLTYISRYGIIHNEYLVIPCGTKEYPLHWDTMSLNKANHRFFPGTNTGRFLS